MPQKTTVLNDDEQKAFGMKLKAFIDAACAKDPGRPNHPGLLARLKDNLNTPNLGAKLTEYANGIHFPTAGKIIDIAYEMRADRLVLLQNAGYYPKLIEMIFEIACYHEPKEKVEKRSKDLGLNTAVVRDRWPQRVAIQYAVGLFSGATERVVESNYELAAPIFNDLFTEAHQAFDRRRSLHEFLKNATAALRSSARRRTSWRIACAWIREWAYTKVDPELTEEAERLMFAQLAPLPINVHSSLYGSKADPCQT